MDELQERLDVALDALWAIAHLTLGEIDDAPRMAMKAFGAENVRSHGEAFRKRATLPAYPPSDI